MRPRFLAAVLVTVLFVLGLGVVAGTAGAVDPSRDDTLAPTTVVSSDPAGDWNNSPVVVTLSVLDPRGILVFDGGSNCAGYPPLKGGGTPASYANFTSDAVTAADASLPANVIPSHAYYNLGKAGKDFEGMTYAWTSRAPLDVGRTWVKFSPGACYNVLCVQGTLNPFLNGADADTVWNQLNAFVKARRDEGWIVFVQTCSPVPEGSDNALGASVLLGNGSGGFGAKTDSTTGTQPSSVAVGDFNGDGKKDLVTADWSASTVSVLLGNGSGGFGARTSCATGSGPRSVAVADVNGDGKQDLVTANAGANTVSVLLGNGSGGFVANTDFACGLSPQCVAVADFNADGKKDLVTANAGANTVSVLLGNGSGGFGTRTDFASGLSPQSVAAADFNADGKQDLVTANAGANTVSVLLGNGSGGFGTRTDFASGAQPRGIAVADFNADKKQDVVTANAGANTVSVLLGNGRGAFAAKTDFASGSAPRSVAIADFNGDGKQDLATANSGANTASILLGNGRGSFGAKSDVATGKAPISVAAGTFNADTKADLVTADYGADFTKNGYVKRFNQYLKDGYPAAGSVKYAGANGLIDFSQDQYLGEPALGVWNTAYWQGDHLHYTDGAHQYLADTYVYPAIKSALLPVATKAVTTYRVDGSADWTAVDFGDWRTSGNPGAASVTLSTEGVHTIDYYSVDTALPVPHTETTGQYVVRIDTTAPSAISGLGSPTHPVPTQWYAGADPAFSWSAATDALSGVAGYSYVLDQSSNTVPDTTVESAGTSAGFTGKYDGTWYFHVRAVDNAGNAGPTSDFTICIDATAPSAPTVSSSTHPSPAVWYTSKDVSLSWDCQGIQDFVTANHDAGSVGVSFGNGSGGFTRSETDTAIGAGPSAVTVGDVNSDGLPDLVTANSSANTVTVLLGDGIGGFGAKTDYATGSGPCSVAVGDVNADGRPDLVTANNAAQTISVLLGNGDGTFAAGTDFATGAYYPQSVAVGDFNRDGKQDVVTANSAPDPGDGTDPGNGTVSVLLGNGNGSFAAKTEYATGSAPQSLAVGDLNGDGKQDLVVADVFASTVSVLLGNGDGSFAAKTDFATGTWPVSVAVADFNGDGKQDLVTSNLSDGTVSVLIGNGSGSFAAKTDFAAGNWPQSVAVGDFNGDGRQDLVTANNGANTVSVLLGNGNGSFATKTDFATGSQPCAVAVGDFNALFTRSGPTGWVTGFSYATDHSPDTVPDTTSDGDGLVAHYSGLGDGVWYFHVRGVNKAGTWGATRHFAVRIDTSAPVTTDNHDGLPHSPVTVSLFPTDVGSGVAFTEYRIDGGAWQTGTTVTLVTEIRHKRPGYSLGNHLIEYRSTDNAGNVETIRNCTVTLGT